MMKRSLAYIATAVVLGTALMLAPVYIFPTAIPYGVSPDQYFSPFAELKERSMESEVQAGVRANQPTDAIFISLMFIVSLVSALGASLYLKKRMPNSVPA